MSVLVAMAIFIISHVVVARTGLKRRLLASLGERGYLATYSALSVGLLGWVIVALLVAERTLLWPTPSWAHAFAVLASLAAFALIGMGVVVPNPLSVAFRTSPFDPDRPGMIGWVRHPLIWGLSLWGLAHVPANGDWPSLLLFGGSAAFGAAGILALERRFRLRFGANAWRRWTAGPGHLDPSSLLGLGLGLMLWITFLWLHPILFRVDPWAVLMMQVGP